MVITLVVVPGAAQITDLDGTESNNGMFDDGSGFGINSASDMAQGWSDEFLDPTGFVKGFYNDLMGFTSQEREFEQQMKMTQYENWWNSAPEQMKRAKEAGINPLTAAGGIAGNGSGSVASAGGAATPSSAAADAIHSLAGLSSEANLRNAQADQAKASARNTDRLADAEILSKAAAAAAALTSAGLPEIQAMENGLALARKGLDGFSAIFNAEGLCRKFDQDMDYVDSLINTENMRFEDLQSHVDVNKTQSQLNSEKAEHETILKNLDDRKLQLVKKYEELAAGSDFGTEFAFFRNHPDADDPVRQAWMSYIQDKFYHQNLGSYSARVDTVFDEMFNSAAGSAAGNAENERFLSFLRQNEEWVKSYLQFKFSPDYEIFLSKISGWLGPEYNDAYDAAVRGRGNHKYPIDHVKPRLSDYKNSTSD